MYQVPPSSLYPPQLHPHNMGVPPQYNSHHIMDQQLQGLNIGGELPLVYSIPVAMSYSNPNQVVNPNYSQPYYPQNCNPLPNQQGYNFSNGYSNQALEIRSPISMNSSVPLNSVWQLQGNFKIANSDLNVTITHEHTELNGRACNVVHRSRGGETLPDQFLYEEDKQFTLCSADGCIKASIMKGSNVKDCVTWVTKDGVNKVIWERSNEFSPMSSTTPHSYTPGLDSSDGSSLPVNSSSTGSPELSASPSSNEMNYQLNAEAARPILFDANQQQSKNPRYDYRTSDTSTISPQDHALFELIKAQCNRNSWLKGKIVDWGISHGSRSSRITKENAWKLSHGRLWITIRTTQSEDDDDESFQDTLNDLKGAYQECEPGVYKQPAPQGSERGAQHRLLKSAVGLWLIEKYSLEQKAWNVRAREEPDGRWMDLQNNRMIHVCLVPLLNVLEKLREGGTAFQDVEKHLNFLFNSCNQKKLHGKLRTRNLNHNIANLKAKLEKQYALSFSVIIARTAGSIA